jgi:hypothetical protein
MRSASAKFGVRLFEEQLELLLDPCHHFLVLVKNSAFAQ